IFTFKHIIITSLYSKPYVFAHIIPGMYTSAVSIFSAGTTFNWIKENLCKDLKIIAEKNNKDIYALMNQLAEQSPIGANKLLFNPSLGGGTHLDYSVNIRGAYMGLDLKHNQSDLIRSCMEGIIMNMRLAFDLLRKHTNIQSELLVVGGGSKSRFYRELIANIFNMKIIKSNIDQGATALGA